MSLTDEPLDSPPRATVAASASATSRGGLAAPPGGWGASAAVDAAPSYDEVLASGPAGVASPQARAQRSAFGKKMIRSAFRSLADAPLAALLLRSFRHRRTPIASTSTARRSRRRRRAAAALQPPLPSRRTTLLARCRLR